jgi:hypothetical protein
LTPFPTSPKYPTDRRKAEKRDPEVMVTVYDAAGGADGLLALAGAWHARVIADEVVAHAFSHPEMDRRAIACFDAALVDVGLDGNDRLPTGATRLLRVGNRDHDVAV